MFLEGVPKGTMFAPIRPFSNFLVPFMGIAWGFGRGLVGVEPKSGNGVGVLWGFGGGLVEGWWGFGSGI